MDLDERRVSLEVKETKNHEARTIYLDDGLLKLLRIQSLRKHKGCKHVFTMATKESRTLGAHGKRLAKRQRLKVNYSMTLDALALGTWSEPVFKNR